MVLRYRTIFQVFKIKRKSLKYFNVNTLPVQLVTNPPDISINPTLNGFLNGKFFENLKFITKIKFSYNFDCSWLINRLFEIFYREYSLFTLQSVTRHFLSILLHSSVIFCIDKIRLVIILCFCTKKSTGIDGVSS